MSTQISENVCYNNPFFESDKSDKGKATIQIENNSGEKDSTESKGNGNSKVFYKLESQSKIFHGIQTKIFVNIPPRYEPVVALS